MLDFLSKNLATVLVAAVIAAAVALIIVCQVRHRKKGSGSCGPACSCCPNAECCCHSHVPQDRG